MHCGYTYIDHDDIIVMMITMVNNSKLKLKEKYKPTKKTHIYKSTGVITVAQHTKKKRYYNVQSIHKIN